MSTLVAFGTPSRFEFFREKDLDTLEIWEALKVWEYWISWELTDL